MKWCLDQVQFQNHALYWPTQTCGPDMPVVELTMEEVDDIWTWMSTFKIAQMYLDVLSPDENGNYWLQSSPLGETGKSLFWPVEEPVEGGKKVFIGPAKKAKLDAAFDGIDAMQTFLRGKMVEPRA